MSVIIKKSSKNLFDKSKAINVTETASGFSFTNPNVSGSPTSLGLLRDLCPDLKVGDIVTHYGTVHGSNAGTTSFFYLRGQQLNWHSGMFATITQADLDANLFAYGRQNELCEYIDVIIARAKKSEKNLLENTATSQTINGVTFTVNDDGSLIANGTASAGVTFTVAGARDDLRNRLQGKELILTGCPSGGSDSTYRLQCHGYKGDTAQARDRGNGVTFTFTNVSSSFNVSIVIATGTVCDNLVFKPMIRPASIEDDTYEPYLDKTPIPYEPYSEYKSSENLFADTWEVGSIGSKGTNYAHDSQIRQKGYTNVKPNTAYACSNNFDSSAIKVYYYDKSKNHVHNESVENGTFTTPEDIYYIRIRSGNLTVVDAENVVFMLNQGTEALPYEPYIEPKSLPSSASKARVIKDGITTFLKTIKVISGGVETVVWKAGAAVTYVVDSGVPYTEDVDGGASCLEPKTFTPTKEGWTFVGWREDTTASSDVLTEKLMADTPITLYAVYSKVILLSYNGNSSTGGSTEQQKDKRYFNAAGTYKDPTFKLSANGFTRTNYTFAAWAQGSASGTQYKAGDSVTLTGSTTFYAYWVETTKSFAYTGGTQPFTAPIAGTYKLVCYGAQGGSGTGAGGKGGYAYGNVSLTKGQTIYVVVGGVGQSPNASSNAGGYNGGGAGCNWDDWRGGSGGGCTHIGTFNETLASHGSTNGLFIVAGGGGGGGQSRDGGTGAYTGTVGGTGGGTTGGDGVHDTHSGTGGTQSAGGYNKVGGGGYGDRGSFGKGGSAPESLMGGGGGGGLYGGGAGYAGHAAGGGSGYVGGCISGTTGMTNGQQSGNGSASITLVSVA